MENKISLTWVGVPLISSNITQSVQFRELRLTYKINFALPSITARPSSRLKALSFLSLPHTCKA